VIYINIQIIKIIIILSTVLGLIKFGSLDTDNWKWQGKVVEIWNDFFNFLISGLIAYYFILVRLPIILDKNSFVISDFILFIIFVLGVFGHLCIMSKNITEGVEAILSRVLEGKKAN